MTRTATNANGRQNTTLRTIKISAAAPDKKQSSKKGRSTPDTATEEARGQPQQNAIHFEEMVDKGLDLAEAGIGIGFNIVARLGSIFKDQVYDKIRTSDMLNSVMGNNAASQGYTENNQGPENSAYSEQHRRQTEQSQTQSSNDTAQSGSTAQAYYLFNRLPLFPGAEAALSFSINNDSLTKDKKIRISVEGFVGEAQRVALDASMFSVSPGEIAIAPADFEKFVLKGAIPADVPADNYHGWLTVSEQELYRIPVILAVSNPDQSAMDQGTPPDPTATYNQ